jgi:phospholipid-binding lipoprotein MlaA
MKGLPLLLLAGLMVILPGCATLPSDPAALAVSRANNDPLEPMNRELFALNQVIDRMLLKPVAKIYVRFIPQPARDAIRNLLKNFDEPVVFANAALEGRFRPAGTTASRFAINSTVGLAGLFDVAARHGLERQQADFGRTLHAWGIPEGPYLILPVVGPSSPRDAVGSGVDIYVSPWRYVAINNNYPTGLTVAQMGLSGIDERSRNIDSLDEIQRESVDYYATFRSLYRQNRAAELGETAAPSTLAAPSNPAEPAKSGQPPVDFYSDPDQPQPHPPP